MSAGKFILETVVEFLREFDIPSGTAQQRKHGAHGRTWTSSSLKIARATWQAMLEKYAPSKPYEGPLMVTINLAYNTKDRKKHNTIKITRPDADNLLKVILDAMMKCGYFLDDAQVQPSIARYWTTGPSHVALTMSVVKYGVTAC